MAKTALILGASGKIGSHAKSAFTQAGWNVRVYDRSADDMRRAARGVDVIVNGLNPPRYHDWAHLIPAITRQVIAAARVNHATVIVPGNVYNLDALGGEWSENTPHAPPTRKGRIRENMERAYREAGVQTIVLRAGNFIDPKGNGDMMSLVAFRELAAGKITSPGDPRAMQAYCYVPDWARAAVGLAEIAGTLNAYEDVPFAGHSFTIEQLSEMVSAELGGRTLRTVNFPWWLFTLTGPFWELAREMNEMRYLWSLPHTLSGAKLARLLPEFQATDLRTVIHNALLAQPKVAGHLVTAAV